MEEGSGTRTPVPVLNLKEALTDIDSGMSIKEVASKHDIPVNILINKVSGTSYRERVQEQSLCAQEIDKIVMKSDVCSLKPDGNGMIINDDLFRKKKSSKKGIVVSTTLACAILQVLDGGRSCHEVRDMYKVSEKTLRIKIRQVRNFRSGKDINYGFKKASDRTRTQESHSSCGTSCSAPSSTKPIKSRRQHFTNISPHDIKGKSVISAMGRIEARGLFEFPFGVISAIGEIEEGKAFLDVAEKYNMKLEDLQETYIILRRVKHCSTEKVSQHVEHLRKLYASSETDHKTEESTFEGFSKAVPHDPRQIKMPLMAKALENMEKSDGTINERASYNKTKKHHKMYESKSGRKSSSLFSKDKKRKLKNKICLEKTLSKTPLCLFCHRPSEREVEFGKFHSLNKVTVHYYCLLFSCALEQNGKDQDGILGFLPKDIMKEISRGSKLKCRYCGMKGATIGCNNKHCKKKYHFPCGLDKHAQFVFTDNFRSLCYEHRKFQVGQKRDREVECPICLERMIADPKYAIWPPCCQRSSWFHKVCLQRLALSAGYFFKCPLCNDRTTFVGEMMKQGIFVPEQDASWELEPNAYHELLQRPNQCEAVKCKCPSGRKVDEEGSHWELILCNTCGSTAVHLSCAHLSLKCTEWTCFSCKDMLQQSEMRSRQDMRKKRVVARNSRLSPAADVENDNGYEEPVKRIRTASSTRDTSPSTSVCSPLIGFSISPSVVDSASCSSVPSSRGYPSSSARPSTRGRLSFSSAVRGRPRSSKAAEVKMSSSNEELSEDEEKGHCEVISYDILRSLVIRDLEQRLIELPEELQEMKQYAERIPFKLAELRTNENYILSSIGMISLADDNTITLEHLYRFIRCTFNMEQMQAMRKILQLIFLWREISSKCNTEKTLLKKSPFNNSSIKLCSLYKRREFFKDSLLNILEKVKTYQLLEGTNLFPDTDSDAIACLFPVKDESMSSTPNSPRSVSRKTKTESHQPSLHTADYVPKAEAEFFSSQSSRYLRIVNTGLDEKCAWCNMQLYPGIHPTTVKLSLGQLQIICSDCLTCNVINDIFPRIKCKDSNSAQISEGVESDDDDDGSLSCASMNSTENIINPSSSVPTAESNTGPILNINNEDSNSSFGSSPINTELREVSAVKSTNNNILSSSTVTDNRQDVTSDIDSTKNLPSCFSNTPIVTNLRENLPLNISRQSFCCNSGQKQDQKSVDRTNKTVEIVCVEDVPSELLNNSNIVTCKGVGTSQGNMQSDIVKQNFTYNDAELKDKTVRKGNESAQHIQNCDTSSSAASEAVTAARRERSTESHRNKCNPPENVKRHEPEINRANVTSSPGHCGLQGSSNSNQPAEKKDGQNCQTVSYDNGRHAEILRRQSVSEHHGENNEPPRHRPTPVCEDDCNRTMTCSMCEFYGKASNSLSSPAHSQCLLCKQHPLFCSLVHFDLWHSVTHNWMIIPAKSKKLPGRKCKVCHVVTNFYCPACTSNTGYCSAEHFDKIHVDIIRTSDVLQSMQTDIEDQISAAMGRAKSDCGIITKRWS